MAGHGPSTRVIARVFLTVALLAGLLYLLWAVRSTLMLVFIAIFFAVALGPPTDFMQRRLRLPRGLAIIAVYIALALAIFGVGLLIVPPIVDQVDGLAADIPGWLTDLRDNDTFREYDDKYDITQKLSEQAQTLPQRLGDAAGALQSVTVGVFSAAVQLVTVLTLAFFLLLDGRRVTEFAFGALGEREHRFRKIATEIYRAVSGYVAGNLLISVLAGTSTYVVLSIADVPFAVPLAVLMAFLDLIPLVGATIGGVVIALVTLFTDFPTATIIWGVFFLIYQQVENNVFQPIVYRRTVDVHPLVVIVAILIGAGVLGVLGALVAIPIAAAVQIVVRDWWRHRHQQAPPDAPPAIA